MASTFQVGLTGDFLTPDGRIGWGDIGLSLLTDAPGVEYRFLEVTAGEIPPEQLAGLDALVGLLPRVTARSLENADRLRVVARFGVGYDNVDVAALTARGTLLTITRDAVARPVAQAALALILAVSHRLLDKDRLVREHRWQDRLDFMGTGITGRTVAFVGWGNIGRTISGYLAPFGVRQTAHDPYADPGTATAAGVELGDLDTVLGGADFVVVTAALTEETRNLVDAAAIARMKPSAFLVNVARGPIVDQGAVAAALTEGRIAGAALDVFRDEPPAPDDPILSAPNTLFSPHATCWTDELALANGTSAIRAVLDVRDGKRPRDVVNPEAFDHPALRELR
ncbi:D-3-phosphoglycerate dehydrogenase [Pseudonocardia hierapolitana]|uniref:D-3-phosphoglycerate dehydrogenase n=1 Tax=Pseudonocardia hierapolitana TaxID=1128676 RepID=A0A561SYQ0_9PSEU|nr:NAD(P)-dependent oxidoreductase [Pseudonocardia hierapolitana]TWF79972.1 D-3-phosphoglycerate dehydrogenase [Pseudonocardia hierapolitana]